MKNEEQIKKLRNHAKRHSEKKNQQLLKNIYRQRLMMLVVRTFSYQIRNFDM